MSNAMTAFSGSGIRFLLTALIIVAAAVVILLLMRSFRNWYWKTDEIIDTMKSMDDRIGGIEDGLDSLKISAEKINTRLEEARAEMASLEEKTRLLLEFRQASLTETEAPLLPEEEIPAEPADLGSDEAASLLKQTEDLEKEVEALKQEKQRLKDEINARIRD